ncbi:MAG: GNAT family N-acetyltransferase [Sulfurovum sp.]|nr:MAG: GNAT family N-acetyltransferase [Sulfurovum sp.]
MNNRNNFTWISNTSTVIWQELSDLYTMAPLGKKEPHDLEIVFNNSMFKYFVYDNEKLIGVGRALADGVDCSYICDVAIHPEYQGRGIGKAIIEKLVKDSKGHTKIILYAVSNKEPFYAKFGFAKMKTAMAIFKNQSWAREIGLVE